MYTGWLIYEEKDMLENSPYIDWFIDEARNQQLDLKLVLRENLTYGINQNGRYIHSSSGESMPDFAIVRVIDSQLTRHLEALNVKTFNNSFISETANDKAITHQLIHNLGIPMVHTVFLKKRFLKPVPPLDYPFIVKSTKGRGGTEVYWVSNKEEWHNLINTPLAEDLIAQETNVQVGKDMRVFIIGKEIIGAIMRSSTSDYRANFKLGGSATFVELNKNQINLVMKIVDAFDFGMVGIDFLIGHNNELIFNEIEDIVGSRTLSATTDINILEKYCIFIKEKLSAL